MEHEGLYYVRISGCNYHTGEPRILTIGYGDYDANRIFADGLYEGTQLWGWFLIESVEVVSFRELINPTNKGMMDHPAA